MPTTDLGGLYNDRPTIIKNNFLPPLFINPPKGFKPFGYLADLELYPILTKKSTADIGGLFSGVVFKRPADMGTAFAGGAKRTNLSDSTLFTPTAVTKPSDLGDLLPDVTATPTTTLGELFGPGAKRNDLGKDSVY